MGYICDFCHDSRSIVYCNSDAASLCLSCDSNVHSANSLSKGHLRTLVCGRCYCKPAFLRCVEERMSLCHECDLMLHVGSNMGISHKKHDIKYYSGCPSAVELSASWPFLLHPPSVDNLTCEQGIGLLTITDTRHVDPRLPQASSNVQYPKVSNEASEPLILVSSTVPMEPYAPLPDPVLYNTIQPGESNSLPKMDDNGSRDWENERNYVQSWIDEAHAGRMLTRQLTERLEAERRARARGCEHLRAMEHMMNSIQNELEHMRTELSEVVRAFDDLPPPPPVIEPLPHPTPSAIIGGEMHVAGPSGTATSARSYRMTARKSVYPYHHSLHRPLALEDASSEEEEPYEDPRSGGYLSDENESARRW